MTTNEKHAERLEQLAGNSYFFGSLDALDLLAGADALRDVEGAKAALEHAMRIFANNGLKSKGIDRIAAALKRLEEL